MKEAKSGTRTIGDIVAADFRTATVFKEAGIDFCCGGKMTLEEACGKKGIDPEILEKKLENPGDTRTTGNYNFNEWEPGFLCDYIVNVHHTFIRKTLPDLLFYTKKIARVHGGNHPELEEVADLFEQVGQDLSGHLQKEEDKIFPAVKAIFTLPTERSKEVIRQEMKSLLGEHEFAGGAMDRINAITDGYRLPSDACNSYRFTFELLEKFEDDLHTHVHLENNILFPRTIDRIN